MYCFNVLDIVSDLDKAWENDFFQSLTSFDSMVRLGFRYNIKVFFYDNKGTRFLLQICILEERVFNFLSLLTLKVGKGEILLRVQYESEDKYCLFLLMLSTAKADIFALCFSVSGGISLPFCLVYL